MPFEGLPGAKVTDSLNDTSAQICPSDRLVDQSRGLDHKGGISAARSAIMRSVKGKNTKPEMKVRQLLHRLGYRFRLHVKKLPGSPDLVFPGRRAVIFVHGCFWHRHGGCKRCTTPKTRANFWAKKFERNKQRDAEAVEKLSAGGWRVLVLWECELKEEAALTSRLVEFLEAGRKDLQAS